MEKKKLDNEEIVKALKFAIAQEKPNGIGYWNDKYEWVEFSMKDVFDLIHRLQAENEQLKCNSYTTSWKGKFFEAKKEIERLTEENGYLKQCADNFLADYQKAQQQVDELKKYKEFVDACKFGADIEIIMNRVKPYATLREKAYQQAVKDTADKIFRQVLKLYQGLSKGERETMTFEWKLLDLAVEYGVEVE